MSSTSLPDHPPKNQRTKPSVYLIIAGVIGIYGATFICLPHDGFWINDNGCKFIQMEGMMQSGYRDFSLPWPGNELDPRFSYNPLPTPFGHVVDGKLFGTYSPVFPLLCSLPYRVFGFWGLYILPLAGAVLLIPAVWVLAGMMVTNPADRRIAQTLSAVLTAFCTPIWFYSQTFWEHTPAVCLTTWSIVFWSKYLRSQRSRDLVYAALLCGFAIYLRDELYLLAVAMTVTGCLYSRRTRIDFVLFLAVVSLALLPLWIFQWSALGHPLGFHLRSGQVAWSLSEHLADRRSVLESLLVNCHAEGWISIAVAAPFLLLTLLHPRLSTKTARWLLPAIASYALVGGAAVLHGYLHSQSPIWWTLQANGLFAASPILLLGFFRYKGTSEEADPDPSIRSVQDLIRPVWVLLTLYIVFYVLTTPKNHASGIHWGCRYLLSAFPIFAALAATNMAQWWARSPRICSISFALVSACLVCSILIQIYSLTLLRGRKQYSSELNSIVAARPETIVAATGPFIPQQLFRVFFDKSIFLVHNQRHGRLLFEALDHDGIEELLLLQWSQDRTMLDSRTRLIRDGRLNFMNLSMTNIRLDELLDR